MPDLYDPSITPYEVSRQAAASAAAAQAAAIAAASVTSAAQAAAAQAAAIAASQPLDSDLTAIAALTTTAFGRSFLALADAAAGRTLIGANDPAGIGFAMNTDPRPINGTSVTIGAANRGQWSRVTFGGPVLATKIAVWINVSSGNLCVAVHSNSGTGRAAVPGARKGTSGSVASPGTGYQEIALGGATQVDLGDWLYLGADNVTVTFEGVSDGGNNFLNGLQMYSDTTAFPAPNPPSALAAGVRMPLVMAIA